MKTRAEGKRRTDIIMIKLDCIEKSGGNITCNAYVEDCKEAIKLIFNIADKSLQNTPLPSGYEWCRSHIGHARRALAEMAKKDCLEKSRTIMWY